MTRQGLIQKYFQLFKAKGHQSIANASLIPAEDPSVLFTTAGMHPLVPYLLGEKHPQGNRLYNVQKCIRTSDIDLVGDPVHLTFFEMLGNWSLGDPSSQDGIGAGYWKKEMIDWSFEFLTKELGLKKERLWISYFGGEGEIPEDKETKELWSKLVEPAHIISLGKKDNFWGPVGKKGPCGPDTEMFYDTGKPECGPDCGSQSGFTCSCGKYVEIWNDVFMEYNKTADGQFAKLKQRNIDTGMGVERTLMVLNGLNNVYETETLKPLMNLLKTDDQKSARVIVDHLRAAVLILGEGIAPSNLEQGYVARRLIRSAIRRLKMIRAEKELIFTLVEKIIEIYGKDYPYLKQKSNFIFKEIKKEQEKFLKTLAKGLKEFEKNRSAFELFTTYGFPLEMTQELRKAKGLPKIDEKEFWQAMKKHQALSRVGAEKKFKGGLVDQSEQTKKLHTATHLLHAALRKVLGNHVKQKGSNITEERLRFDFCHPEKMTKEQIQEVEDLVNEQIGQALLVEVKEMTVPEAKKAGAIGLFEQKYGDKVKVYSAGDFSREICGGPHVNNTSELGHFRIKKEESSSAGIRRIKAILEN